MLSIKDFSEFFFDKTRDWNWEVEGFLDTKGFVHPIDRDTKVISTVFERLSSPVVRSMAKTVQYAVELANQTTYPDFTLTYFDSGQRKHRIAIDIQTTYLSNTMMFTLGGYNSFLRNDTKSILHPYSTYEDHWVIGFVYQQNPLFQEYDLDNLPKQGSISCPYTNVKVFIREKHAISGLRAGSGNTKNIGSVKVREPKEFDSIKGPFLLFSRAKEACDAYWRQYERYSQEISTSSQLAAHPDFAHFK